MIVEFHELSSPSQGLMSMPCARCGAVGGQWCRRRSQDVNKQHAERYAAWRQAGMPLGSDGSGRASVMTVPVLHTLAEHLRDGTLDAYLIDGPRLRVEPLGSTGCGLDVEVSVQHGRFFSMSLTPQRIFGSMANIEAAASRIKRALAVHQSDSA